MKSFCIKRGTKRAALAGLTVAALGVPRPAAADGSLADQSMATQLFKEGRALLDQGRVAPACRKLEESQRLGPGGGTLLNLALCHQKEGRTATAWVEFTEALGIARRDERQPRIDFARAHLAELEPLLSRLSIQVPAAADLPNLEIKRDGGVVGRAAWGSAIPVDPGDHLIEAAAPGKMHWKQSVVVGANAESKVVVMPALEDAPVQDTVELATPEPQSAVGTRPEPREPREPMADRPSRPMPASPGTTVPAWIFFGVGVAAAGAGTYFAALAVSQKRDANRNCPNDACSADGARQNSEAIRDANYSTIGFGVGLAGLGLGAILFATRSGGASNPPQATTGKSRAGGLEIAAGDVALDPRGARVTVSGRW